MALAWMGRGRATSGANSKAQAIVVVVIVGALACCGFFFWLAGGVDPHDIPLNSPYRKKLFLSNPWGPRDPLVLFLTHHKACSRWCQSKFKQLQSYFSLLFHPFSNSCSLIDSFLLLLFLQDITITFFLIGRQALNKVLLHDIQDHRSKQEPQRRPIS
ncbi:MAG: hypothetical protein Q8P67_02300 [archaeon]|nr:hypothetical protein [archaeon]